MCAWVGVPKINNFLKNKGDIQALFPTTKRYSNVLDQTNEKVSVVISAKAWVVQVIRWKKKSGYRSHREGVVLVKIKYLGY